MCVEKSLAVYGLGYLGGYDPHPRMSQLESFRKADRAEDTPNQAAFVRLLLNAWTCVHQEGNGCVWSTNLFFDGVLGYVAVVEERITRRPFIRVSLDHPARDFHFFGEPDLYAAARWIGERMAPDSAELLARFNRLSETIRIVVAQTAVVEFLASIGDFSDPAENQPLRDLLLAHGLTRLEAIEQDLPEPRIEPYVIER